MLVLMRHSETKGNVEGRFQGSLDYPLTSLGEEQSQSIKDLYLSKFEDIHTYKIVSSPSKRCLETLRIALCDNMNHQVIETNSLLYEQRFGLWEGHTREELQFSYPDEWQEYTRRGTFYTPILGESFEQAKLRAKEWLHFNYENNPNQNLIVCTHKRISLAIRQLLFPGHPLSNKEHLHGTVFEVDMIQPYLDHKIIWRPSCH